ncbi:hypothetical protein MKEN_00946200 [Mycena kentingensis (nom. inval.)]|nr:hypothetical protein MKEN_00946200 [Mycena kentingensis (nom. inval.)]
MSLTAEEFEKLRDASTEFLADADFNIPEIEEVLGDVFGSYHTRTSGPRAAVAQEWAAYFSALQGYERESRDEPSLPRPVMPSAPNSAVMSEDAMDIVSDASEDKPAPLAKRKAGGPPRKDAAQREKERQLRRSNGNEHGKPRHRGGAQFDELSARLVIESSEGGKIAYYCIGCDHRLTNNAKSRLYPHAVRKCPGKKVETLFPEDYKAAKEALMSMAPSSVVEGAAAAPRLRTTVRKVDDPSEGRVPGPQTTMLDHVRPVKLTASQQARVDFYLLRMVICCALAWALVDNGFFVDFCKSLNSSYHVPSRSDFFSPRIAAEVEKLMAALFTHLTALTHLTMSFDGWSSRFHDEIYTVHVTTALRSSFLVDGLVLTGQSVCAELLCTKLGEVLAKYSARRFSLIVSDTTGNVKKTRRLVCLEFPWIFNCGDPCHQLNLLAKDLILGSKRRKKVSPLADVVGIVAGITSFFSHSNYGQYWLREELKGEEDKRGVEAAGGTRFSTFSTNAKSVARCLPAMMRAYEKKKLKFETAAAKKNVERYLKENMDNLRLKQNLKVVNALLTPIDRGLKTLEGLTTTLSDVFMVYIRIAVGFTNVFAANDELLRDHHQQVYSIFDYRFNILMTESTPDMFLVAYFLDPVYYPDGALRLSLPDRRSFSKETASPLFHRILQAAVSILEGEQARHESGGEEQVPVLCREMIAYAYREPPFDRECKSKTKRLPWFEDIKGDPRALLISMIGVKVHSVSPSEMTDERTASRMTAINTAKRNKLTGYHIIEMAQLQQHWTYGLAAPETKHTARLDLPEALPASGNVSYLPTPRLDDLLNPATDADFTADAARMEEQLFNPADPYDLKSLSDGEDDEDDDEEEEEPMVIRGAPRLAIEDLVNLTNPRLLARYEGKKLTPSVPDTTQTPAVVARKWVPTKLSLATAKW